MPKTGVLTFTTIKIYMKKLTGIIILCVLTTAIVSTTITYTLFNKLANASFIANQGEAVQTKFVKNNVNLSPASLPDDFVTTSAQVTPAIVNIISMSSGQTRSNGSGVIVSENGYIITNNHVVSGGDSYEVTTNDKRSFGAKVVGVDPTTDLALLKIDARNLRPLEFGDSDNVKVGEWVLAVGNPFNLTSTVTLGIVSAKARNINILSRQEYSVESFIQTDAVVNPGNSGGALVDSSGKLVGINAAILTETGSYEGYSFAIPSNLARKVINDLKEYGEVRRAILGIRIQDVTETIAQQLKLNEVAGVLIDSINPNSSAEDAGLQPRDVIIELNGKATNSTPELQEQVARLRPGSRVDLKLIRNGRLISKNDIVLKGLQ